MHASTPLPDAANRNRLLLVLFTGVFMAALDTAILAPVIPTLRTAFQIDNSQVALITIVFVLFSLTSTAPMASLSDRYGRRPIYLLNVGLFSAGSLLVALAPNFAWLLVGRALQGAGSGGITPTASAVIGDVFPVEQRGKALGLMGATFGLAFIIGPLLASLVLLVASWQWLFLLNLPVALVIMVMAAQRLPTGRPGVSHPPFDFVGMLLLFGTLLALALGINRVADRFVELTLWPWFLLLALLLLPLLIFVERRAAQPIISPRVFGSRQLVLSYVLAVGAGFGMGSVIFITSLAVEALAFPEKSTGFLLVPMVICSSAASVLAGRVLNATGSRTLMLVGFGALVLGSALLGVAPHVFALFLLGTMLIGVGVGISSGGTLRYVMLNEVGPGERAAAQGLISISINVGNLLVVAVLGAVADSYVGDHLIGLELAYLVAAASMALMMLFTMGLKSRHQEQLSLAGHAPTQAEPSASGAD